MKQIFLMFLVLFNIASAKGQDIAELDKRNGFKTLKIGDNISKYQNNLTLISSDSKTSANTYDYTTSDEELYNVFDSKMIQILLTFDKDKKMVTIMLHKFFKDQDALQEAITFSKSLEDKFVTLFGNASSKIHINTKEAMQIGLIWVGSKINLKSYVDYQGFEKGTFSKIVVSDNDFVAKAFKSGFLKVKNSISKAVIHFMFRRTCGNTSVGDRLCRHIPL